MNWLVYTLGATLLWGTYTILAAKAGRVHGGNVNALLAGLSSFITAAIVILFSKGGVDIFKKVTKESLFTGLLMGSLYGIAFLLFMKAVELKPDKLSLMCVITGAAPVITVLANHMLGYGDKLSVPQWIAAALVPVVALLANWE